MTPPPDRRRHERIRTVGTVTLTLREGWFGRRMVSGSLVDVSIDGLQARLPAPVPEGCRVKVLLALGAAGSEAAIYRFPGRIIWSKEDATPGHFLAGVRLRPRPRHLRGTWQHLYEALRPREISPASPAPDGQAG